MCYNENLKYFHTLILSQHILPGIFSFNDTSSRAFRAPVECFASFVYYVNMKIIVCLDVVGT